MKAKTIISALVLILLVAWLGYYGYSHRTDFAGLSVANPWLLVALIVGVLVTYSFIACLNNTLLRALKVIMPIWESFALAIITGFYNLITPFRGGMAARAVYLKKKYDFAYVHFLATLSAVYVLIFLVGSALGIVSTLWIYFTTGVFSWILFVIFDVVFIGMLGIIFVSPKFKERGRKGKNSFNDTARSARSLSQKSRSELRGGELNSGKVSKLRKGDEGELGDSDGLGGMKDGLSDSDGLGKKGYRDDGNDSGLSSFDKWLNRFIKVVNGWHLIKKNGRVIAVTLVITLIQVLISSLMLWLQFRVFGIDVGFASCIFLSAIGSLGLLISITPGSLGINEAIIVFSAMTIGITPAESLSAALLGRAVSLVVLFVLGPIFSYTLVKNGKGKKKYDKGSRSELRGGGKISDRDGEIVKSPSRRSRREEAKNL